MKKQKALSPQTYSGIPDGLDQDDRNQILSFFERKYTCSGVCTPGLFYFSLDLSKGVPKTTCLAYAKEEIGSSLLYSGIAAIICGIFLFILSLCNFALCSKYKDTKSFSILERWA